MVRVSSFKERVSSCDEGAGRRATSFYLEEVPVDRRPKPATARVVIHRDHAAGPPLLRQPDPVCTAAPSTEKSARPKVIQDNNLNKFLLGAGKQGCPLALLLGPDDPYHSALWGVTAAPWSGRRLLVRCQKPPS